MEAPQRCWRSYRRPSVLLFLLSLSFLFFTLPFTQGSLHVPPNLPEPPVLLSTPESLTAFSSNDISLDCEARGNPTPTFRWVKDDVAMDLDLVGKGTIRADKNDTLEDYHGSYRCYASNTLGTAVTQTVHVTVERHPVLQNQKKKIEQKFEGDSLVMSCNPPESSTPPHIHWMDRKMVHIKLNDRVTAGLNGSLYFANLLKSDSRPDYTCNAQYAEAMTVLPETSVSLTVLSSNSVLTGRKPDLFTPSGLRSSMLALKGNSLTLECIPSGLPTPKVEWIKKDGRLEDTGAEVTNYGRWLHFESVEQSDDGEYQCRAHNEHGEAKHSFTVTVEAAPYWVKAPQNLMYAPRENVRLDCQAEGIPTPNVTWSMNGLPLSKVDPEPRRTVSGSVLKLMDVEVSDTAVFQCEAQNKHGSILLNTYINVVELPAQILTTDGHRYRVTEGGDITLQCEAFGSPQPHVTWEQKNSSPLLSLSHVSLLTDGTLQLFNTSHSDSGEYICSVHQSNISITAHLEVYDRSVIVTSPDHVRAVRGSTTLLHCEALTDPRLKHDRQIVWRKDGLKIQESSADDKFTVFENGTLRVSSVHTDDSGEYSCEVITSLDHVHVSGAISVIAPPDPPVGLSLSEDDGHMSITLGWTPGFHHNSPITEFIVEAREQQHTEKSRWKWEELRRVPGDVNEIELRLHPFCTYRFRVTAVNELGPSEPSQASPEHSTQPAIPTSNPTGVRSESKEPGTLVITWDEMEKRFHNGHGFMYKVFWRQAGKKDQRWHSNSTSSPPFVVTGTGTYTPFEIKVQAVNAIGEGPVPEGEIGHSGEDVPLEAPGGVNVTVVNSTAKVKWNEAENVRGLLLGYKIYIRRVGLKSERRRRSLGEQVIAGEAGHEEEEEEESERVVEVRGMKTSHEISGLKLYSLYDLSVTAFNSKGQGPPSPMYRFETPEGAPGPPASLTSESPTDTSLILIWTPPLETNGILLGYTVQYQQEGGDNTEHIEIRHPHTTHLELPSLNSSTYYLFNVRAQTAKGHGPARGLRAATLLDGAPPSNVSMFFGDTYLNLSWVPGPRDRNHGFHIDYRRKGAGETWEVSEQVNSTQGFYSLTGLEPGTTYHLRILHHNSTQWEQIVQTKGPDVSEMPGGFATQGWFIGLISAIVLLVLILLILCLIKRRKGGKYAVKDKEDKEVDSEARPMKDETFGEYSDGDEKRTDSQPSLCPSKLGSDDSLAEYGDSVDIQFNEDGSFIGQYSGRGPVPHGNESSSPASPMTNGPPPPLPPVLSRPS
ncbi:neural cell adhesion molecule L1.1-like [Boleophthalmus pectinirostris]|uniref:neural cell adhesion molecule L1.1-like n=1 Tax=Boleophthalmus pectinirostris TaxID=150288 RepID=UPI000A1C58FC|nr:neural cell adhesion molecule L1.1-like [Boleophthalmus pectinirostris]